MTRAQILSRVRSFLKDDDSTAYTWIDDTLFAWIEDAISDIATSSRLLKSRESVTAADGSYASATVTIGGGVATGGGGYVRAVVNGTEYTFNTVSGNTAAQTATGLAALIDAGALWSATPNGTGVITITAASIGTGPNAWTLTATAGGDAQTATAQAATFGAATPGVAATRVAAPSYAFDVEAVMYDGEYLPPMTVEEAAVFSDGPWEAETGDAPVAYIYGPYGVGVIRPFPAPSGALDATKFAAHVVRIQTAAMSSTSSVPELPSAYHNAIVYGACVLAYSQDFDMRHPEKAAMFVKLQDRVLALVGGSPYAQPPQGRQDAAQKVSGEGQ